MAGVWVATTALSMVAGTADKLVGLLDLVTVATTAATTVALTVENSGKSWVGEMVDASVGLRDALMVDVTAEQLADLLVAQLVGDSAVQLAAKMAETKGSQ